MTSDVFDQGGLADILELRSTVDAVGRILDLGEENRGHVIGGAAAEFVCAMGRLVGPSTIVEIGTGLGFSTVYLARLAMECGSRVLTFERSSEKQRLARALLGRLGLEEVVDHCLGNAVDMLAEELGHLNKTPRLFLIDGAKNEYADYLRLIVANTPVPGPYCVVADNIISHRLQTGSFISYVDSLPGKHHQLVPIGKGLELITWRVGSNG